MVSGDCAESCWLLENVLADCAEHYYYDWGLETVQITPISTGYWRPVQSTPIITGTINGWLLENVPADCAEHYYYDWLLETVHSPAAAGYWRLCRALL